MFHRSATFPGGLSKDLSLSAARCDHAFAPLASLKSTSQLAAGRSFVSETITARDALSLRRSAASIANPSAAKRKERGGSWVLLGFSGARPNLPGPRRHRISFVFPVGLGPQLDVVSHAD